ncbi:MAG: NAD(P)H-hydrate epimerase, partial [Pararhizobium sp.]
MTISDRLVTPEEMGRIDHAVIESGISGWSLMHAAGEAVAARVLAAFPAAQRVVVLAGPGNNGGDGYVAAAAFRRAGVEACVFSLGDPAGLEGDAGTAWRFSEIKPEPLAHYAPKPGDVVVDALFGAGLSRPLTDAVADCIARVKESGCPVVAVDLPSGVNGLSGAVMGTAFEATETVTFFARKPGHLLMPGRHLCGRLTLVDIGIPQRYASLATSGIRENGPDIWSRMLPRPDAAAHKYARGHLVVFSGGANATGAARLAASVGLRAGAGLVTVASPDEALATNAAHLSAVMVRAVENIDAVRGLASDQRISAYVLGPGFGVGEKARAFVKALAGRHVVLDADGITSFSECRSQLFDLFAGEVRLVMTPHPGEFSRLFPDIAGDGARSKVEAARRAAGLSNAVVVRKGADTVVAAPDGRAVINTN